ncbi:MAG: alpha-2-macroglobulin [Desulfobacteraceae bacterium]
MAKKASMLSMLLILATIWTALPAAAVGADFKVLFVGQRTIKNRNSIAVTFSAPVDATKDFNRFLTLFSEESGAVDGAWVLSEKGDVAYFTHIEADTRYEVQIRRGLASVSGRKIVENKTVKVHTRVAQAHISFASKGYILPSELTGGLPVSTMNVQKADVDFFRIKEKHLVDFITLFGNRGRLSAYQSREIRRYADLVYSARFDLEVSRNVLTKATLPISGIKALTEPGLYLAVMRQAGAFLHDYPATYFAVSDIGLHMRVYPESTFIQTQHLASGKVFEAVRLTFLDSRGDILEQGRTDGSGTAAFPRLKKKAVLLVASKGSHTSILPLRGPALDLSAFDLGEQPFRDLELFVYGPRDLYRPGETLIMDALLRDYDGRPVDHTPPIAVTVKQPDGRRAKSFKWRGESLNAYHAEVDLPSGAQTGTWTVAFELAGKLIQLYKFKVEDFIPERMKLTLDKGDTDPSRILAADPIAMAVQGDYLYGAPAAGNRVGCDVSIVPHRKLIVALEGFEFGDVDEKFRSEFKTDDVTLDEQGRGTIAVDHPYANVKSPLKVRLHTSLYESGGRPVSRDKIYLIWPAEALVGVRPLWEGKRPSGNGLVEFEVVKTNADGALLQAKSLAVSLIREYPDYYWEFSASSGWERLVNYQHYPVAEFKLDIKDGHKGKIQFPVEWGPYRLEIVDPDTGLKTSHRFSAGWSWWGRSADRQGNRPDQVVLTLDRKAFRPGETAKVMIKPPESGTAVVMVEGDHPVWRKVIDVSAKGTEVAIPIGADWDRHDLYITAMVIRPGDRRQKIAPKRALGILHLPMAREDRQLSVSIAARDKFLPNTTMNVEVNVANLLPQEAAYVTLAAVDVGVLSITRYETPDPGRYYFNRRRYGVDCYDLYQKIIETREGAMARRRFGGDLAKLTRGGDKPVTDVRIVSLYQGRIKVDPTGKAKIALDLPDFNGRLRLMAVAYSASRYGASDREVTVAAPVVTQIAMPRFLALGDRAELALDVQNLSGRDQNLDLDLRVSAPITLLSEGVRTLRLGDKAKTTLRFPIQAGDKVGVGAIELKVDGIRLEDGQAAASMVRSWQLGTRPAFPAVTRQWRQSLGPGQHLMIPADATMHLIPATVAGELTLTDQPPINVAEHIKALYAYPYGCLEQTTSGIYPQVLITNQLLKEMKIKTQSAKLRQKKVQQGIDRLMTLQKPNGGFGLWSANSPEECWLTAYVCDFLITARERGYEVPETELKRAVKRLNQYLRRPQVIQTRYTADKAHTRLAVQAYSGFVLARLNRASLGTLRTLFDLHAKKSRSGLPLVHLGLALELQGDDNRARQAFERAFSVSRDAHHYYGDYGSPVRDAAMCYYLLTAHSRRNLHANGWLVRLDEALHDRRWMSTQERNALVLAGMQLYKGSGKTWVAKVSSGRREENITAEKQVRIAYDHAALSKGLRIEAAGQQPVYVSFLLNGYSKSAPAAESNILEINRSFYDLNGKEISLKGLETGDLMLVRLDIQTEKRVSEGLVVELLPAGLELENQNLATGFNIDEVKVEDKTIAQWRENLRLAHEEFRDDRYVAAIDVDQWRTATLFYLARVVSPGVFQVPNSYVEDMYRPYIRAVGAPAPPITITQPNEKK